MICPECAAGERKDEIRSLPERTKSGMRRTKSCRSGRDKSAAYRGGWKEGKATPLREERDFTGGSAADFVVKRFRPSGERGFHFLLPRRNEIRSFAERTKSGMRRTKSCRSGRDKSAAYRGGW